jgi:hypothetical protein
LLARCAAAVDKVGVSDDGLFIVAHALLRLLLVARTAGGAFVHWRTVKGANEFLR